MTTKPSILDGLNDLWWLRAPVSTMRVVRALPQMLADGLYLTAWPLVGAVVPPIAFLLGLFLGWQQLTPGDTFTFSILLMAILVGVASLGAGVGAWLWLGYVLADLFLARHDNATYLYGVTLAERVTRVLVQVAVPYVLLAMLLIVTPFLVYRLRQLTVMQTLGRLNLPRLVRLIIDVILQAGLATALIYVWTLAVPTLIRPVYTMVKDNPPVEAIQPLQQDGLILVLVGAVVAAARIVLEYLAVRKPRSLKRVTNLRSALVAEAPVAGAELPTWITLPVQAGFVTFLLAGLFENWSDVAQFWVILLAIMVGRRLLTGRLKWWARLVGHIPLVLRLAAGFVISYFLAQWIVGGMWDETSTFRPIILSTLASLVVFAVLVPDAGGPRAANGPITSATAGAAAGARRGSMNRRSRKLLGTAISTLLVLALPGPVYADNCSGLSDCYGQILAAVLVVLAIVAIILIIVFLPEIIALLAATGITFGEGIGFAALAYDAWTLGEEVAVAEHEEGMKGVGKTVASFAFFSMLGAGLGHLFGGAIGRGWARLFGREAAEAGAGRLGREMVGAIDEVTVNSNVARIERLIEAKNKLLPFNVAEFNPLRGNVNCADVANAVDTTLSGMPRVAGANPPGELVTVKDLEFWYGQKFSKVTYNDIQVTFRVFGLNSRGIIYVYTPGDGRIIGHVINVVNVNGEVIYIDAQRGIASSKVSDVLSDRYTQIHLMVTGTTP